ncbi:MAG: ferredoxin [Paracoccaceae bacterium]
MTVVAAALHPHGLTVAGQCELDPGDGYGAGGVLLISPDEPRFWTVFSRSSEAADGAPDPLDRWSRRVLGAVAQTMGARAVLPSDPPYPPFVAWALRSGECHPSPVGPMVHRDRGLWISFRGALLVDRAAATPAPSPCTGCRAPCRTACPVDAFADGYDVAACRAHVAVSDCRDGCRVRAACPVGAGQRPRAQARFHMEAFLCSP